MENKRGFAALFPLIVIAIGVLIGLFFFFSMSDKTSIFPQSKDSGNTIPDIQQTTTLQPVIDTSEWKSFTSGKKSAYTTENWLEYQDAEDEHSFTIFYPPNWVLEGTVFHDENDHKVAEFGPGMVILSPNQTCFDYKDNEGKLDIVSESDINISGKSGVLRVTKGFYEGGSPEWNGVWYPSWYCIQEGNRAFVMSFYEYTEEPQNASLYEAILSTLEFNK